MAFAQRKAAVKLLMVEDEEDSYQSAVQMRNHGPRLHELPFAYRQFV
jgi:hypothetical protein